MNGFLKSLKAAIFNVMERMFFLLPDPDGGSAEFDGREFSVTIGVTGVSPFRITLAFDPGLASAMTANALGKGYARDENTVLKCLLEAANVIAGNLLQIWDGGEDREITLPSLRRDAVFGEVNFTERRELGMWFEDRRISVLIESDSEIYE